MPQLQQSAVPNRLLASLSADDFALLQPHLERVTIEGAGPFISRRFRHGAQPDNARALPALRAYLHRASQSDCLCQCWLLARGTARTLAAQILHRLDLLVKNPIELSLACIGRVQIGCGDGTCQTRGNRAVPPGRRKGLGHARLRRPAILSVFVRGRMSPNLGAYVCSLLHIARSATPAEMRLGH